MSLLSSLRAKITPTVLPWLLVLGVILGWGVHVWWLQRQPTRNPLTAQASPPAAPKPLATQDLDFTLQFPLSAQRNAPQISYHLDHAELLSEVIVKGQKATAVEGRAFLVLSVKVTNPSNTAFSLNTRDFVRLAPTTDSAERLAPNIHSDPVEIQPIATEHVKIGFTVGSAQREFSVFIGEINGEKKKLDISL